MQVDVSTELGGVVLPLCAMNAAGAGSSTADEMRALAASEAGAVVMKSTTVEPVTEENPALAGLVNPGYQAFLSLLGELREGGKPVIASLAGFTVAAYVEMGQAYDRAGADIIELNLADPHVVCNTGGVCDIDVVRAILSQVRDTQVAAPLAVKLPPFQSCAHLSDTLQVLQQMAVPIVICMNAPVGDTPSSTHVQVACEVGRGAFDVVAVGGVKNGQETYQAIAQGAAAVQIGGAVQQEGPGLFRQLQAELTDLLQQNGYHSLSDLRRASQA
jgi:dihydroorotate dehydrogenase (fumarate)